MKESGASNNEFDLLVIFGQRLMKTVWSKATPASSTNSISGETEIDLGLAMLDGTGFATVSL